jgi:tape measure domain-containing protein
LLQDIAKNSKFNVGDLDNVAETLLTMGYSAEEIPAMLRSIGDAAEGTGKDAAGMQAIADVLGKIKQTGAVSSKDLTALAQQGIPIYDILAQKMCVTNDELKGMLDSQDKVAAAAENLTQAQKDLSDQEYDLGKIARDLKKANEDLAQTSDPAKQEALRNKIADLTHEYENQQGTIADTKDKIAEYTADSSQQVISATDVVNTALAGMSDKYGGEMASASQTVSGQINATKEELNETMSELGTEIMPLALDLMNGVKPVVRFIRDLVSGFKNLPGPAKTVIEVILLIVAAIGPLLVILGTLIGAGTTIAAFLAGPFVAAVVAAAAPFALPVAAIIALIIILKLLWDNCKEFRDAVKFIFDSIAFSIDTDIKIVQGLLRADPGFIFIHSS